MILSRYGKNVSRCRKAVLKRRTEIPMTVRKFSLVELFCTISIIILLAAVLLATLNKARNSAKSVSCLGNMKQSMTYLLMYLDTYEAVHTQRWSDYLLANVVLHGNGKMTIIRTFSASEGLSAILIR